MRQKALLIIALLILLTAGFLAIRSHLDKPETIPPTAINTNASLLGVFEGRVPCKDCERVKVRLILYTSPSTYVLERINVGTDNTRHITTGHWTTSTGSLIDADAKIYRLDNNAPEEFRLYQTMSDDLLLFLQNNLTFKVGDAGHSFTLNRTN